MRLNGLYQERGKRFVKEHWQQVCNDCQEFPQIRECCPGTFNIRLTSGDYKPPGDEKFREMARKRGKSVKRYEHGNHVSPTARVTEINGIEVVVWIYRGGHFRNKMPDNSILELLSIEKLSDLLSLKNGDPVYVDIEEVSEGTTGMPTSPPARPGVTVGK
ncbi:hypothetical protein JW979_02950 [bacterium]|nr:hypothetical protein [candidate division CSSED10-310 bacterium]